MGGRFKRLARVFVCSMTMSTAGLAAFAQVADSVVSGKVVDSQGVPVAHAEVTVRCKADLRAFSAQTDEQGMFGFKLSEGVYSLTVRADGFDNYHAQNVVDKSAELNLAVTLAPAKALEQEFEALKQKVLELESQNRELSGQNRQMMELLLDLKSKLESNGFNARVAASSSTEPPAEIRSADLKWSNSGSRMQPNETASVETASQSRQAGGDSARWSELIGEGNRFKIHGAMRLDLIFDSHRPNNAQSPLFIPSNGFGDPDNFTMHPRLTTFGIDYTGPELSSLADGRLSGRLQVDFQNGGAEFAPVIRILEAYLRMDWGDVFILGGQKWDTFSPLRPIVNDDSVMFTAGNTGLRRPQLLIGYEPKTNEAAFSIVGGIGLSGAVDAADLDGNGIRDGEESGRPQLQARIGYGSPLWVEDQKASIGISGVYGFQRTFAQVGGRNTFRSKLGSVDFTLPLTDFLSLRGEGWWGRNMSDFGGGAGQGVNFGRVRGRGGWSELGFSVNRYYSFHPGFTTDDPRDSDVFLAGITRNRAFYVGNRIKPGDNLLIGVDYLRWKTNFRGPVRGLDNRVNLFFQYSF